MKTLIIGAGPAGLITGIFAAKQNNKVIILEKNEKAGKKIFITGKGRCNVTNNCQEDQFINNVVSNARFLYSAVNQFSPQDTMDLLENNGVKLVVERGNRVFPASYHASDITNCLLSMCKKHNVEINYNEKVLDIYKKDNLFYVKTMVKTYIVDNLVIATGGKSYKSTGSTGDGYIFAQKFGHTIIETVPALSAIKVKEDISKLNGLTLKNVTLNVKCNKWKHSEFGELIFRDNLLDGPIVLSVSSLINRLNNVHIELDLKPALDEAKLQNRIARDIDSFPKWKVYDLLKSLLPIEFINYFATIASLDLNQNCNCFSLLERNLLINYLKHFPFTYLGLNDIDRAIVTAGGINVKEIDAKTMESKIESNLYFAGEIIDVDAFTGGFNMQIAFSTGATAGKAINDKCQ